MVFEIDIADPRDPLNEAFRRHFSQKDSTLFTLILTFNQPVIIAANDSMIQCFC